MLHRGNKMWEGHRMTLPEHVDALGGVRRERERYEPPTLSEDLLTEIGRLIEQSYRDRTPIQLTVAGKWEPLQRTGIVVRIDAVERWLVLQSGDEREMIPFRSVLAAEEVRG